MIFHLVEHDFSNMYVYYLSDKQFMYRVKIFISIFCVVKKINKTLLQKFEAAFCIKN